MTFGFKSQPKPTKNGNYAKYNNKPFWRDPETGRIYKSGELSSKEKKELEFWDSFLEFKTYRHLCDCFSSEYIKRQHKIDILPENALFPKLSWNVDFAVFHPQEFLLIETKGRWIQHNSGALADFCKLLRIFYSEQPLLFACLQIVSDKEWQVGNTKLTTIPVDKIKNLVRYEHFKNE